MWSAVGGLGRAVAVAGLLLSAAGAGWGQDPAGVDRSPDEDVVEGWLRSGDARVEAWGAVWALREWDRALLTELTGMAGRWEPLARNTTAESDGQRLLQRLTAVEMDRRDAMAAVLDGVIQMKGEMPAEVVERFAGDFPAQAVVLLARMPARDRTAVLLRMFREGSPELRRAAASMLALSPPAGFAGELLRGTTVRVKVWVSLPGDERMGSGSSSCCGAGAGERTAEGWPEVGQYRLEDAPETVGAAAGQAVIPGVRPIAAVRSMGRHFEVRSSGCGFWLSDSVRVDLLAEMLQRKPSAMALKAIAEENLVVANEGEYRRQLAAVVAERERQFGEVTRALAARGFLSEEELEDAGMRPGLLLLLVDGRSRREFAVGEVKMEGVRWEKDGGAGSWAFYAMGR